MTKFEKVESGVLAILFSKTVFLVIKLAEGESGRGVQGVHCSLIAWIRAQCSTINDSIMAMMMMMIMMIMMMVMVMMVMVAITL